MNPELKSPSEEYANRSAPNKGVSSAESNESVKSMTLLTIIPDKSLVSSQLSLLEQAVFIDMGELNDYFEHIDQFSDEEAVKKATLLTVNNLSAANCQQWETASQDGQFYSLGDCIKEKMCTCFHRSIMFNILMNRQNVSCVTLDGRVIETKKEKLYDNPKIAPILAKNALQLGDEEETAFEDAHVWNTVQTRDGKYYLIDTAFLIGGHPVINEIEFDNTERNTFTIPLSDGRFRHYLSTGTLTVQQIESDDN